MRVQFPQGSLILTESIYHSNMSSTTLLSPLEILTDSINSLGYIDTLSTEFVSELMDYGIDTVEQFEESYQGQYETGAEFAEQMADDCGYLLESKLPMFIQSHIDWETVWTNELSHDYFAVKRGLQDYVFFCSNF